MPRNQVENHLPSQAIFTADDAVRWEIGGKVFKACFYYENQAQYPTSVYCVFMVKISDGVWKDLYRSDVFWPDLHESPGAEYLTESMMNKFNDALRAELGLPEQTFVDKLQNLILSKLDLVANQFSWKQ